MTPPERDAVVTETERWLVAHGLPYFVESEHEDVDAALGRPRLVTLVAGALLLAGLVAAGVGWWTRDPSATLLAAIVTFGAAVVAYAVVELSAWPILRWAVRHTLGSLRLLFPLVTRALPLLLLFVTFLFINAEVWQVAGGLDSALLWIVVVLFAGLGVLFLLVRLPEEVGRVTTETDGRQLAAHCQGTPVEPVARQLGGEVRPGLLRPLQRANLLLVLLVTQAAQVLLLSLSVFAFFVLFGRLTMTPDVVQSWVGGDAPRPLGSTELISVELLQVSVFLAAFSALYFIVYAVTDETYRREFFSSVTAELERAIGVLTVYRVLRDADPP
ncbi:MAG: hypothetical protein M3P83_00425 [Actinomycetota bacterium]|nr:hypothetical protein [Actinomycetota bacterium]